MKRLLVIGAHPDDETFFAAGTLAKYRAEGVEIGIVCATRGDAGKTGDLCTPEELGTVREGELRAAMAILGVQDVSVLPYRDKKLGEAQTDEILRHLVEAIRHLKPDVVVTFDPQGSNQHPDHMAISRFANDAVAVARDARWYPEAGDAHRVSRVVWTPPRFVFRLGPDDQLDRQPGYDFVLEVSPWLAQKRAAFEAHRTQFPHLRKLFFDDPNGQRTLGYEVFRFGSGSAPKKIPAEDLFADLS